ncbi:hypothetical protein [Frankia sp. Cas4]|uniref:hypothetical protein n=1 Tax=Frankia sp. Cas4 TaxID=3073927 RepID=UPI002AD59ECC|nr:hypothetical protein [Frankia sp. Cas4]
MVEPTPELLVVGASSDPVRSRGAGASDDLDCAGDRGGPADRSGPSDRRAEPAAVGDGRHGDGRHQVIDALRGLVRVTAILPPRLALVVAPPDGTDALARLPGVVGVFTHTVPAGLRETLTATENLFVDAWLARVAGKHRSGEGLPWDAPGRLPPDPAGRVGGPPSDTG